MKKGNLLVVLLFLPILLFATTERTKGDLRVATDLMVLDAIWNQHIACELQVALEIAPQVSLEIPVTYLYDRSGGSEQLLEVAISLRYHPWDSGPFIGFSLAHLLVFVGPYAPLESFHYLNEFLFGYTWNFYQHWYLEPVLLFRDPAQSFGESYRYIKALVPTYSRFRLKIRFGYTFANLL